MLGSAAIGGRYTEEYGIWRNELITRREYDDGSVFRSGRVQEIDARLEVRQLLSGVTVLVAQRSPLNDRRNEQARWSVLEQLRHATIDANDVAAWVETLPLHSLEG